MASARQTVLREVESGTRGWCYRGVLQVASVMNITLPHSCELVHSSATLVWPQRQRERRAFDSLPRVKSSPNCPTISQGRSLDTGLETDGKAGFINLNCGRVAVRERINWTKYFTETETKSHIKPFRARKPSSNVRPY